MIRERKRQREWIERRINRAIDAMIELQDDGHGCDAIARILEMLNDLRREYTD